MKASELKRWLDTVLQAEPDADVNVGSGTVWASTGQSIQDHDPAPDWLDNVVHTETPVDELDSEEDDEVDVPVEPLVAPENGTFDEPEHPAPDGDDFPKP